MKTVRVAPLLLLPGMMLACLNVRPVDVGSHLEKSEAPIQARIKGVKVAVVNFVPPPEIQVEGAGGDAPVPMKNASPPPPLDPNPRTKVSYTPRYQEAYPTLTHMGSAIPAALREQGFDVVTVSSAEEGRQRGVAYVLQLQPPELEGFRRAQGGGVRLEGTVMDMHVTYRGDLTPVLGLPLGVQTGHGESTTTLFFDDQYLEAAIVGSLSLALMTVATVAMTIPVAGLLYSRRNAAEPIDGMCNEKVLSQQQALPSSNRLGLCHQAAWLMAGVGAISFLVLTAAVSLGLVQFVGTTVFASVTAIIKGYASEPLWSGMLKTAHDNAARQLAQRVADAVAGTRAALAGGAQ